MMTNDKFTLLVHWRSVYTAAGMATGTATSTAADTSLAHLVTQRVHYHSC